MAQTLTLPPAADKAFGSLVGSTYRPSTPPALRQPHSLRRGPIRATAQASAPTAEVPRQPSPDDIFVCEEESHFYSQCIEKLLVRNCTGKETVIEFGSGDGKPVINALVKAKFEGAIHGYELNPQSAALARQYAAEKNVAHKYQVHNSCFFKGIEATPATYLIANPPYIPAPDNDILMPALHGGTDGANLTRDLLSLGFQNAVLLLAAYSNPVETIEHARREGYRVTDFMITPMPFGYYSSEKKVRDWLAIMKSEGKAFYSNNSYLLAGVLLKKQGDDAAPEASHRPSTANNITSAGTIGSRRMPAAAAAAQAPAQMNSRRRESTICNSSGPLGRSAFAADVQPVSLATDDLTEDLLKVMTSL